MARERIILFPKQIRFLNEVGENIKLARLRRKLSQEQIAERADICRPTVVSIEKGNPNVSIGSYMKVLLTLGLDKSILEVAKDDILGRKLQDINMTMKKRAPKRNKL